VDVGPGPDGRIRCWWCLGGAPEYLDYHDREWGRPLRGDVPTFELLTLEAFQSGLSWLTILRKRENFRAAFAGFEIERVAAFDDDDVARLMADPGIVRNRLKVAAAITNARAARAMLAAGESPAELVWSYRRDGGAAPGSAAELPATTNESKALARDLKRRGFAFVGPTTVYSTMQACGVVNDHLAGCSVRREVELLRR
jgi:DNA-3-methyladenine glycosylase I